MKLPNIKIEVKDEAGNSVILTMRGSKADVKMGGDATLYHVNACGMAAKEIRHKWVEIFANPPAEEGGEA